MLSCWNLKLLFFRIIASNFFALMSMCVVLNASKSGCYHFDNIWTCNTTPSVYRQSSTTHMRSCWVLLLIYFSVFHIKKVICFRNIALNYEKSHYMEVSDVLHSKVISAVRSGDSAEWLPNSRLGITVNRQLTI